ncbi:MAG: DUF4422 domain-containing protein [Alphaproteobacteria bacterium]|nr:DUF4422 domain-containing protein [Alphaproteobacteria bacterium]
MPPALEKSQLAMLLGDFGQAREVIASYVADGIRGYELCELAFVFHQATGDTDLLGTVTAALERSPDRFAALMARGVLARAAGSLDGALACFREARALCPGQPDTVLFEARALFEIGALDEAARMFEALSQPGLDIPDAIWNARLCALLRHPTLPPPGARVEILVSFHKPHRVIEHPMLRPIHVGKARSDLDLGFPGDDQGDNISSANDRYCELTAQYWAWKNPGSATHVGFCHYRRYFWFGIEPSLPYRFATPYSKYSVPRRMVDRFDFRPPVDFVTKLIAEYDIVVPRPLELFETVREQWSAHHPGGMLDLVERVLALRDPQDGRAAREVFDGTRMAPFNMFIMRREVFEDYAAWLFGALFLLDEASATLTGAPMEPRMAGYLGERLLNVFLHRRRQEGARVLEAPIVTLL